MVSSPYGVMETIEFSGRRRTQLLLALRFGYPSCGDIEDQTFGLVDTIGREELSLDAPLGTFCILQEF